MGILLTLVWGGRILDWHSLLADSFGKLGAPGDDSGGGGKLIGGIAIPCA